MVVLATVFISVNLDGLVTSIRFRRHVGAR
jgi:hypothetical protein